MTEEERFAELASIADQYAAAQAEADHLNEFRKSKKALLMKAAETAGQRVATLQERDAYAHPEYLALLEGLREATQSALALKWRLELARIRFEAWRTKAANRRAEMNLR